MTESGDVTTRSRLRRLLRRVPIGLAAFVGAMAPTLWFFGGGWAESYSIGTVATSPYDAIPANLQAIYDDAFKVDLHADALLWKRDLTQRHARGHVDLPRLQEADVAVQVFGLVTKVPATRSYEANDESDALGVLGFLNHWPVSTWGSGLERAHHQARVLQQTADRSEGQLVVLRTAGDLEDLLDRRASGDDVVGGVLAAEGLHLLDGDVNVIDDLFDSGLRMAGLAHFFDNEVSGSSSGVDKHGLTELGRSVIGRMDKLEMIIDLAHVSPAAIEDVLAMTTRPVVVSHTGVTATCPGNRNLTDEQVRAVADTGGLIGIGFWAGAVCETTAEAIADAIGHVVRLVGAEHVALGSDFDGGVTTPFDVTGLPLLVQALVDEGLTADEIQQVLGDNAIRFLRSALPS